MIEVPATVVPKGVLVDVPAAPSFNVPAAIVVNPEYVLLPERVTTLVPSFVSANDPDMTPLMVYGLVPPMELAAVMVTAPLTSPAVVLELMMTPLVLNPVPVILKAFPTFLPFKSKAPPLMVMVPVPNGPLVGGGPAVVFAPDCKVPPVIEVPPVYALAPENF